MIVEENWKNEPFMQRGYFVAYFITAIIEEPVSGFDSASIKI